MNKTPKQEYISKLEDAAIRHTKELMEMLKLLQSIKLDKVAAENAEHLIENGMETAFNRAWESLQNFEDAKIEFGDDDND